MLYVGNIILIICDKYRNEVESGSKTQNESRSPEVFILYYRHGIYMALRLHKEQYIFVYKGIYSLHV